MIITITYALLIGLTLLLVIIILSSYHQCPSNKILVVYGGFRGSQSSRCYHGGGVFVIPLIQGYSYLDLTPMTIHVPLKSALSLQNIRINVPSTFIVALDTSPSAMNNAAIRLLGLSQKDIESTAIEIIIGQLRLTVASLRIEEINQDRERFLEEIKNHLVPELHKVGLTLLNVNITDIHDESGYIESIGKKSIAIAVNQAKIDVAEQEKRGEIGKAEAEKQQRIEVSAYNATAVTGENEAKAHIAFTNSQLAQKQAEADQRAHISQQESFAAVQKAKSFAEISRLEAEQIIPREIEKRKIEILAQAEAQKRIIEAKAQADSLRAQKQAEAESWLIEAKAHAEALKAQKQAEAEGLLKVLQAKADGYKLLLDSCNNNENAVTLLLLIEKLEEMAKIQVEAIKNIKIDKVTVWDSGKEGQSNTAQFLKSITQSIPPLHEIAKMSGIKLPEFLGSFDKE